jgi:hypothetical protein
VHAQIFVHWDGGSWTFSCSRWPGAAILPISDDKGTRHCAQLLVEMALGNFLPSLALNRNPPDLSLPSSKDYRCEALAPGSNWFLTDVLRALNEEKQSFQQMAETIGYPNTKGVWTLYLTLYWNVNCKCSLKMFKCIKKSMFKSELYKTLRRKHV